MSDLQKDMRFGNLMIQLGLLSEADLSEAAQLAADLALPLGKVLVMSGFISDGLLHTIVQAQSLLKDQVLELDEVKRAIAIVIDSGVGLQEALNQSGWVQKDVLPANKLGELLVESGIISAFDLEDALRRTEQSGLPLGRILSLSKKINDALLCSCLNAQILLRDGKIDRQQAVQGLKAAQARQTNLEEVLADSGEYRRVPKATIRLGEMFVLAGILDEEAIMEAIELGLVNNEPVGQVLVNRNQASINLLDHALKLQDMVNNGKLTPLNTADVLRQVHSRNIPLSQAVAELGLQKSASQAGVGLAELLKQSGVINEEEIREAFREIMSNSTLFGKILTITGFVDEETINSASRAQFLVKQGYLTENQAVIALNYSKSMSRSLDEALVDLGWALTGQARKPQMSAPKDGISNVQRA